MLTNVDLARHTNITTLQ